MSYQSVGTKRGGTVTGGWLGVSGFAWAALGGVTAAVWLINATSVMMEDAASGRSSSVAWPFVREGVSAIVIVALFPVVAFALRRFAPERVGWPRAILGHVCAFAVFTIAHVIGMVLLRDALLALIGERYPFGPVLERFVYEGRKDALSYVSILGALWVVNAFREGRFSSAAGADGPARLEIRDGARRVFLAVGDITQVQAAGNYVEIVCESRVYLRRGTLAAMEAQLVPCGFVRIHRSRLVNPANVKAIETTRSGDFVATLSDGAVAVGSRRYREALEAALSV